MCLHKFKLMLIFPRFEYCPAVYVCLVESKTSKRRKLQGKTNVIIGAKHLGRRLKHMYQAANFTIIGAWADW